MFAVAVLLGVLGYMSMYAGIKDVGFFSLFSMKGQPPQRQQPAPGTHRQGARVGGGR